MTAEVVPPKNSRLPHVPPGPQPSSGFQPFWTKPKIFKMAFLAPGALGSAFPHGVFFLLLLALRWLSLLSKPLMIPSLGIFLAGDIPCPGVCVERTLPLFPLLLPCRPLRPSSCLLCPKDRPAAPLPPTVYCFLPGLSCEPTPYGAYYASLQQCGNPLITSVFSAPEPVCIQPLLKTLVG